MTLRVFLFSLMFSLALPQIALANNCSALFDPRPLNISESRLKTIILREALSHTKIRLSENTEKRDLILSDWDLTKSSPAKIEKMSQALVFERDGKRTFFQWVRDVVTKGNYVKEAVRVRSETLILTEEILRAMKMHGFENANSNSKHENYLAFKKEHYNKIQAAKFVVFNGAIMAAISHLTGTFFPVPMYFPNFDILKNLDLREVDLKLIQTQNFEKAYPTILQKYKMQLRSQLAIEQAPRVFFLSIASYIGYNYLSFKVEQKVDEVRYSLPADQQASVYKNYFEAWKVDYESREGRPLDMKNAQDREAWETFVKSLYHAWADTYNAKNGHYPNITKEADLREWEQFLASAE